jgi:hypothetical protein
MEYVLVSLVALLASGLTMYSGFGLGTLLMPVFALFIPVELAVAATAIVHGANNVLKASLLGRLADRTVILRFGLPAVAAALVGAALLGVLSELSPVFSYTVLGRTATISPLKLLMALLMFAFAVVELHPRFAKLEFDRKLLPLGGLLSGFFGGLSGHQGALRSAFLAKVGISAEAFVGTNAVLGLLVDLTRISVYAALVTTGTLSALLEPREGWLVLTGALAAFAGVLLGKRIIKKVTMRSVQRLTGVLLFAIAVLLAAGII